MQDMLYVWIAKNIGEGEKAMLSDLLLWLRQAPWIGAGLAIGVFISGVVMFFFDSDLSEVGTMGVLLGGGGGGILAGATIQIVSEQRSRKKE
ncbi:MAG: hypothetical protein HYS52_00365 [Candidatus Wildermuthbacteria bacterium]|nr:hypothetical protein [Candidatus Wildermuthbacteria bacterium]